jgi:hypothetical protein
VKVDALTVFDAALPNGLASVADGAALRVHGSLDAAAGVYTATRIEPAAAPLMAYKVRGTVKDLDTAARTFRIGAALFSYTGTQPLLVPEAFVRVTASTTPVAGRWVVVGVVAGARTLPDIAQARLRGPVTAYTSGTSFSINGRPVDATTRQLHRTAAGVGEARRVGGGRRRLRSGVLIARKVEIQSDDDERDEGFELEGSITSITADLSSFVLRGQTVSTQRAGLIYEGGKASDLKVGAKVQVKGVLSADGQRIEATRIEFDN